MAHYDEVETCSAGGSAEIERRFGELFATLLLFRVFGYWLRWRVNSPSTCHFDIEQAFVQSDLEKDVYTRLAQGCGRLSGKIVRLNKRLHGGLKQASRQWYAHLARCLLTTLGFLQCNADACVSFDGGRECSDDCSGTR